MEMRHEILKNILIGGAWPYANGSLHIGHIAALLPGDVLPRYYRAKGERAFYVSGSDCHGTPITIRARQEGVEPQEISERYHAEFCRVFDALGFSYDRYTKTSDPQHVAFVQAFHRRRYESPLVEERTVRQAYCPRCGQVLTDRMAVGRCSAYGEDARGDQCDSCGEVLEPDQLLNARCAECGTPGSGFWSWRASATGMLTRALRGPAVGRMRRRARMCCSTAFS